MVTQIKLSIHHRESTQLTKYLYTVFSVPPHYTLLPPSPLHYCHLNNNTLADTFVEINNNNNNKRPLTPKSKPPAGDEHTKLKT